jgi:hypothetical protein
MDLLLHIVDPPADLASVTVDLRVDDQSQADARARNLEAHSVGPLVPGEDGRLRLTLPVDVHAGSRERPALNLRVRGVTADGTTQVFINTGEVLLPSSGAGVVRADVFPI